MLFFRPHFYIAIFSTYQTITASHTGQKFSEKKKIFCKAVQPYFEILLSSLMHKVFINVSQST